MSIPDTATLLGTSPFVSRVMKGSSITFPTNFLQFWKNVSRMTALGLFPPAALGTPASTPGATCDNTTAGACLLPAVSGGHVLRVLRVRCPHDQAGTGTVMLCDRLVEVGGITAVTGSQTVNSAALPARAPTNGVGVFMALDLITQPGGSSTPTVTVTYTNSAGTAGQTTAPAFTGSGWGESPSLGTYVFPLAAGDVGVRSVQSVAFSVAASSAGSLAIVLFRPICVFDTQHRSEPTRRGRGRSAPREWIDLGLPSLDPASCMQVLCSGATGSGSTFALEIDLVVD